MWCLKYFLEKYEGGAHARLPSDGRFSGRQHSQHAVFCSWRDWAYVQFFTYIDDVVAKKTPTNKEGHTVLVEFVDGKHWVSTILSSSASSLSTASRMFQRRLNHFTDPPPNLLSVSGGNQAEQVRTKDLYHAQPELQGVSSTQSSHTVRTFFHLCR